MSVVGATTPETIRNSRSPCRCLSLRAAASATAGPSTAGGSGRRVCSGGTARLWPAEITDPRAGRPATRPLIAPLRPGPPRSAAVRSPGGRSILWEFLRPLRPLVAEKATVRFETPPGRQAQVDWGVFKKPGRPRVQGFVFTLGWSRASFLDFAATQALAAFLRCHEGAFQYLGGVPEEILYDRTKTVWLRDDDRGDPVFHPGLLDFAGHYGFRPRLCRPRRAQTKGKVENGVGYAKKNFWPRVVDYKTADDLTGEARFWLDHTANVRVHGTTDERPVDRLPREGLRPVAGIPPYRALVLERRRVAKD